MRLIDADALLQDLGEICVPTTSKFFAVANCVSKVKDAPTVEIFAEIEKIIDKHYNIHIFGCNDLEDEEKEAVMNFSADVTYDLAELKNKYIKDGAE